MIDNPEFWALIVTILGGFAAEFGLILNIKDAIGKNAQRIEEVNNHAEMEFAKCRIHGCKEAAHE